MAIQVRRGLEEDLDVSKAVPGEFLVSTDTKKVRVCIQPGIVKELASAEDVADAIKNGIESIEEAEENALINISDGVDKTLSVEGKAADAKVTGDKVSQLSLDIGNLISGDGYHFNSATDYLKELSNIIELTKSKNIFNKYTIAEGKALSYSDGAEVDSTNFFTSDFIRVIPTEKLYFSRNNVALSDMPINRLCYYDREKQFLGFVNEVIEFEIPINCYYVRFHYWVGYQNGLQIEYDEVTPFEEYGVVNSKIVDKANKAYETISTLGVKEFITPSKLYCVAGHEMNLYYDNCIYNDSIKNVARLKADINNDDNHNLTDHWYWTPSENDSTFTNAFRVYFNNTSNVDVTNHCVCYVVPQNAGSGKEKKCLFIGDSITAYAGYLAELVNLFENDAMSIELLGTRQATYEDSSGNERTVSHEGRGGWSAKNYCTNSELNGVSNEFWHNGKFDFTHYMSTNNYSSVDNVFLMLGTNDLSGSTSDIISYFTTMINEIKSYSEDIQIFVSLCPPLSSRQDRFDMKNARLNLVKALKESFGSIENVHLVPLYANIDPLWDFPYVTDKFNSTRHNNEYVYVTDNTHPLASGHYKMADVLFAIIKHVATL